MFQLHVKPRHAMLSEEIRGPGHGVTHRVAACNTGIPHGCWFCLLPFQSSCLLMSLGKQQGMAQVLGLLNSCETP